MELQESFNSHILSFAYGDSTTHEAGAKNLLLSTHPDSTMDKIWEQVSANLKQQFQQMGEPEELKPIYSRRTKAFYGCKDVKLTKKAMRKIEESIHRITFGRFYFDVVPYLGHADHDHVRGIGVVLARIVQKDGLAPSPNLRTISTMLRCLLTLRSHRQMITPIRGVASNRSEVCAKRATSSKGS